MDKTTNRFFWFGDDKNKGLGVFSFGDFRFKLHHKHNPEFKIILPLIMTDGITDFNLFAIWTNNPNDPDGNYITQLWKAIYFYDDLIAEKGTILMGDFNSSIVFDSPKKKHNFSVVLEMLQRKSIYSTYHNFHEQQHGKEIHQTFYLYRHMDKPYHLDYCFVSADLLNKLEHVEVGTYEDWIKYSDHIPLISTFKK
jgi:exodeoxyribonuclease-3